MLINGNTNFCKDMSTRRTSVDISGSCQTHLGFPGYVLDEFPSEHEGLRNLALVKGHPDGGKAGGCIFKYVGGIPYGYHDGFGGVHVD